MDLADVVEHTSRLGSIAYLATTSPAGLPHVVPVHVDWHNDHIYCMVGGRDVKTRNIEPNPHVCIHYEVGERTDWDSLIVWGAAPVMRTAADKRQLWTGVFSYDLDDFEPGGPGDSPDTCFVEIRPQRALLLRSYGLGGRVEWRRPKH